MIYNTRNWSNDTKERQKKNTSFNVHFQYSQSKITRLNKMWSLKSLALLKCERKTTLHAIQYKWHPGSVLMFCSCHFKWLALTLYSYVLWDSKPGFVISLLFNFFAIIKAFVLINCSYKKRVYMHVLEVYVKEGLPFRRNLSLENF